MKLSGHYSAVDRLGTTHTLLAESGTLHDVRVMGINSSTQTQLFPSVQLDIGH